MSMIHTAICDGCGTEALSPDTGPPPGWMVASYTLVACGDRYRDAGRLFLCGACVPDESARTPLLRWLRRARRDR